MNLVPSWREAYKWFSVQVPAINMAFLATWSVLPAKFQDALPAPAVIGIAFALILAGIGGRLIDQSKATDV